MAFFKPQVTQVRGLPGQKQAGHALTLPDPMLEMDVIADMGFNGKKYKKFLKKP